MVTPVNSNMSGTSSWIKVWIPTKETEEKIVRNNPIAVGKHKIVYKRLVSREHLAEKELQDKGKEPRDQESEQNTHSTIKIEVFAPVDKDNNDNEEDKDNTVATTSSSVQFLETACLEETLKDVLNILQVQSYTSQRSEDDKYILTSFCLPSHRVEVGLICLQQHGIGNNEYTSVSVIPSTIFLQAQEKDKNPKTSTMKGDKMNEASKLEKKIEEFYTSVKSRMLVAEVIERIREGGKFTFDFVMLLVLAGCIAFMGLIESSSVVLVASMLVSPLMGPILAGIFGTVVNDRKLRRQGIVHETYALIICLLIGLLSGLIFAPWIEWYGIDQWPTKEMLDRGSPRALAVGVLIAVPSGAGVALSVLGGNAGSLVGVAISASLLPPAVNCGVFWAIAIVSALSKDPNYLIGFTLPGEAGNSTTDLPIYETRFSDNLSIEAVVLGTVSFALTLVNIICIIITGIGILKLKEVTPEKIPQSFSRFWKRDVKAHRDYYRTYKKNNEVFLSEARDVLGIGKKDGLDGTFIQSIFDSAAAESHRINIKDWVASTAIAAPDTLAAPKSYQDTLTSLNDSFLNIMTGSRLRKQTSLDLSSLASLTELREMPLQRQRSFNVIENPTEF